MDGYEVVLVLDEDSKAQAVYIDKRLASEWAGNEESYEILFHLLGVLSTRFKFSFSGLYGFQSWEEEDGVYWPNDLFDIRTD